MSIFMFYYLYIIIMIINNMLAMIFCQPSFNVNIRINFWNSFQSSVDSSPVERRKAGKKDHDDKAITFLLFTTNINITPSYSSSLLYSYNIENSIGENRQGVEKLRATNHMWYIPNFDSYGRQYDRRDDSRFILLLQDVKGITLNGIQFTLWFRIRYMEQSN